MIIQWSKNWIRECIACLSCGRIINQTFLFFNLCHVGKSQWTFQNLILLKKFPVYITNFKRNWYTDLIKFWASCSIITGRAANITILINTTTPPPPTAMLFFVMCFTTEKLKLNLWSLMSCLIFDERGDQSLEDVVS